MSRNHNLSWQNRCADCPKREACDPRLPLDCPAELGGAELVFAWELPGAEYVGRREDGSAGATSKRIKHNAQSRENRYSQGKYCLACWLFERKRVPITNGARYWLCLRHVKQFQGWRRKRQRLEVAA